MWKPESATLVEDWKPSSAVLVDDWKPATATEVDDLFVEPSAEDIEIYRRMGVKQYRSPSGKLYDLTEGITDPSEAPTGFIPTLPEAPKEGQFIGPTPEPTEWQKFKRFFIGDRSPLSPKADRMEYVDRAFDIAIGSPLRVFLKFSKGVSLNIPELAWASIKRITPDSMWDEKVKNMSLDEAMDWAAGYDPSGFEKTIGGLSEFVGRLRTAGQIGTSLGLLGKTPKDISVLAKAGETAKLFGLAAGFEQIAKNLAEKVEPTEAEYGAEGKEAVLRDMAIGAILSVAHSGLRGIWTKLKPTEQARALKLLGLKKGATEREIIQATRQMALKTHPDKVKGLEEQFKQVMTARELLIKGPKKDIVYAKAKPAPPKLLTGERPSAVDIQQAKEIAAMDAELRQIQRPAPTIPKITPTKPVEAITPPVVQAAAKPPVAPEAKPTPTVVKAEPAKVEKPFRLSENELNKLRDEVKVLRSKLFKKDGTPKVRQNPEDLKRWNELRATSEEYDKYLRQRKTRAEETAQENTRKLLKSFGYKEGDKVTLEGVYAYPVTGKIAIDRATGKILVDRTVIKDSEIPKLKRLKAEVVAPEAKPAVEKPSESLAAYINRRTSEYLEPLRKQQKSIEEKLQEIETEQRRTDIIIRWPRKGQIDLVKRWRVVQKKIQQSSKPEFTHKFMDEYKGLAKPKMRPGFVDITPVLKAHKTFMKVLEPSKAVERKVGKESYAAVIKGIHQTDVGRVEFNQANLFKDDKTIQEFGEWLDKFPDEDLRNVMLSRGKPMSVEAELIQRDAIRKLPKELRSPRILGLIQKIADYNYKYLQSVVGDDINRVADYFYGIYKDSKKVDKFLDSWRTTDRFTKEKKLPTVADAVNYGLELRDNNPVNNLRSEYVAIAHLEGMNWLKNELMRTGEGKFIDNFIDAPVEWDKVNDPVFSGLTLQPDLAKLINNLIATNKITKVPILDTLRQVNNFLRTVKFIGSAFHLLSVAKQSVADSGYLGFYKIAKFYERPGKAIPFGVRKGTAIQGITSGFRKNDPVFRTPAYKDYIKHGGGHRYSVESEARMAFTKAISNLNKEFGKAAKLGALPLQIPVKFVNWMFNSYIPKVKYAKYLDFVVGKEKKLGRSLTSPEKIDIIKEQQNFYGMMNERLFGRSGTVTTGLRFYFMSPGYAEGNYRTMIKAATQWGGKEGYKASRSRSNIVNSLILTGTLATVGTMIMTGKWPKKPETIEDIRDLFKIDTGKTDDKGRRIMIDLMTYDKDYWQFGFNVLKGRPDVAVKNAVKRIGGMKAPTADMIVDLALVSMGRAIYDWKGDRVTEITDPFLRRVMKLAVYEVKKLEPISVSVFKQSKKKEIDTTIAAMHSLLGFRLTKTEKDKREQEITSRIYSLKGQQEELYQYLGKLKEPRRAVERYNKTVNQILDSKMVPPKMREEWRPKLLIDIERLLANKVYYLTSPTRTDEEIERAREYLQNFGITAEQAQEYLNKYWARERKKAPISPLERDRVLGRGRKRKRLQERYD